MLIHHQDKIAHGPTNAELDELTLEKQIKNLFKSQ